MLHWIFDGVQLHGLSVNEHQDLRKRFSDEVQERKRLYNKVLELKGKSVVSSNLICIVKVL